MQRYIVTRPVKSEKTRVGYPGKFTLVIGAGRVGFLLEQIEIQEKGHPLRKAKLEDEVIKKC